MAAPTFLGWVSDHTVNFVEDSPRAHALLPLSSSTASRSCRVLLFDLGEVSVGGGAVKDAISVLAGLRPASACGCVCRVRPRCCRPEIYAGTPGNYHQVTHLNDGAKPPSHMESIEWQNEGFQIQGWLTYPAGYDPAKKYPILVNVHGGPSAGSGPRWGGSVWSELGYFVFAPNPRGSFGQGEKFTAANIKDFGYGDFRDILAGLDAVEKKVSVDKNREGLTGGSYGGFMTMFGVTQTTRFKAAIAVAGISNWQSYYGEKLDRSMDDSFFRRLGLRRPGRVFQFFRHRVHQEGKNSDTGRRRRPGWRVPTGSVVRVLACAAGGKRADAAGDLSQ